MAADTEKMRVSDMLIPMGIVGIVLMMVMPLPPAALDLLLTVSIALALGIFLTALFLEEVLEFSAFPTLVLVATLLRLSLNVASTRLILLNGPKGQAAAGKMIEAFGRFVVGGQIVVGLVVFLILVVINFIVITKGAGRIAEVAARFTLDAMPGKQMAIDADLSAGVLDQESAHDQRKNLQQEADFYGAMDGASKFVQGDAIAGLMITGINLVGGLILGVVAGMDMATAAETFSVLSVGDALVSQIPALLISSAAGIVVTRSATGEPLGRTFVAQLMGRPRSVGLTGGIVTTLGFVPGMPTVPCLLIGGSLVWVAFKKPAAETTKTKSGDAKSDETVTPERHDVDAALNLDILSLELGYELVTLVDKQKGGTLLDRVAALRCEIAKELGIVVPPVHVCDNLELEPGGYRIMLLGTPVGSHSCAAGRVLAIDPTGTAPPIEGDRTVEPSFEMPARWIHPRDREMAEALGYTVVDHGTVIATHLGELARQHAHRLIGRQELQGLLDRLAETYPKLVDDVVPNLLSLGDVLRVLRNLLRERLSVRDLRTLMESLADLSEQTKDSEQLTELVRERLAPQITAAVTCPDGSVAGLALAPQLEQVLRGSLRDLSSGAGGALEPTLLKTVTDAAESMLGKFAALDAPPLVVAPPDLRRYVRAIFEHKVPQYNVVSFREVEPNVQLRIVGSLGPALATTPQGAM
jgi:flagellar biosynthesis protein FlhA